jgi:hypothetical protein
MIKDPFGIDGSRVDETNDVFDAFVQEYEGNLVLFVPASKDRFE